MTTRDKTALEAALTTAYRRFGGIPALARAKGGAEKIVQIAVNEIIDALSSIPEQGVEVTGDAKEIADRLRNAAPKMDANWGRLALDASMMIEYLFGKAALAPSHPAAVGEGKPLTIVYTNWRGETAERRILPTGIWFGSTDWHPAPQWLVKAIDMEKNAERDFAWNGIDFQGDGPAAVGVTDEMVETAARKLLLVWDTLPTGGKTILTWVRTDLLPAFVELRRALEAALRSTP